MGIVVHHLRKKSQFPIISSVFELFDELSWSFLPSLFEFLFHDPKIEVIKKIYEKNEQIKFILTFVLTLNSNW